MLESFAAESWPRIGDSARALKEALHEYATGRPAFDGRYSVAWNCQRCGSRGRVTVGPGREEKNLVFLSHAREAPKECRGIAHVTGGGIPGNLVRILPDGCRARIARHSWPEPPLFALIQKRGNVSSDEMFRTFNMGIGLLLVVPAEAAGQAIEYLDRAGERAWAVGTIVAGSRGVEVGA